MAKYRGKYKKCRTCKYAKQPWMVLVEVTAECPHGKRRDSADGPYYMTDKFICEECQDWQPEEEIPCKQ